MSSVKPYQHLQRFWHQDSSERAPKYQVEYAVHSLERIYEIALPTDFREYLLFGSPVDERMDEWDCTWWPVNRILNLPDEYPDGVRNPVIAADPTRYIVFADHMLSAWAWAIACTEDENRGRVAIIGTETDPFVAGDFAGFVDLYIGDLFAVSPMH